MNAFLLVSKVRELHHKYSQAPQGTRDFIRLFYSRAEMTGCIPLGFFSGEYHWVVFLTALPLGEREVYLAEHTPPGVKLRVHAL